MLIKLFISIVIISALNPEVTASSLAQENQENNETEVEEKFDA